jgi:hypothetical protein
MPLVPLALRCFPLVLSHLLWERSATELALCSLDSGCCLAFCWRVVDVGASSSTVPANGAKKLVGAAVLM